MRALAGCYRAVVRSTGLCTSWVSHALPFSSRVASTSTLPQQVWCQDAATRFDDSMKWLAHGLRLGLRVAQPLRAREGVCGAVSARSAGPRQLTLGLSPIKDGRGRYEHESAMPQGLRDGNRSGADWLWGECTPVGGVPAPGVGGDRAVTALTVPCASLSRGLGSTSPGHAATPGGAQALGRVRPHEPRPCQGWPQGDVLGQSQPVPGRSPRSYTTCARPTMS